MKWSFKRSDQNGWNIANIIKECSSFTSHLWQLVTKDVVQQTVLQHQDPCNELVKLLEVLGSGLHRRLGSQCSWLLEGQLILQPSGERLFYMASKSNARSPIRRYLQ